MWDNGYKLTIHINLVFKCVYYIGLRSNGCFVIGATLMGGHYMTYIISGVAHSRSNLVVPLVLWTIAFNDWGTSTVFQIPLDSANPAENG